MRDSIDWLARCLVKPKGILGGGKKTLMFQNGPRRIAGVFILVLAAVRPTLFAQASPSTLEVSPLSQAQAANSQASDGTQLTITLQDALERARANDPQYHSALTDLGIAREDRVQARAALLPDVTYNNSFIYTEGTGQPPACALSATCPTSRFIANNGVHEYINQGNAHESVSLTNFADYPRSSAAVALSRAQAEVAARGLVVTVTQAYYGLVVAQPKDPTAQPAGTESQRVL